MQKAFATQAQASYNANTQANNACVQTHTNGVTNMQVQNTTFVSYNSVALVKQLTNATIHDNGAWGITWLDDAQRKQVIDAGANIHHIGAIKTHYEPNELADICNYPTM